MDGEFFDQADAKISVFDHGLLYGDGVFEGIRFYNGRVFRMEAHMDRLWESARSICLEIPISRQEMDEALLETIRQNDLRDGYVRLIVTRGVGNLGLNPVQCKRPSIIIIAIDHRALFGGNLRRGLTVVTVPTRRMGPATLNPAIKSLNYLNNVLARIEANLANADEALMLNDAGNIAECTADNVFVVKRGQIMTPPITAGALRGITRSVVFDIAARARDQNLRARADSPRSLHCGRSVPHRDGGGSHPHDQGRRSQHRRWKAGPDHEAHDRAFPRVDSRNRNSDFSRVTGRAREERKIVGASCQLNLFSEFVV